MYLFSFLWNGILVLIFYISFICKGWPYNSLKCTGRGAYKFFLYIDQHPGNNCVLFIELFTNRQSDTCLQLKNNHSIFIPIVAIWLWGLRNNYLFNNLLQFLTCVLYWFPTKNLDRSWTIGIGQTGRIFFLLKTTQIWVITIVVVLDQSTVTFQKGWGRGLLQFVWY